MKASKNNSGFSLIELIITMVVVLIALGIVSTVTFRAFSVRARESRTSDALTSAQAALSVMSREISNSGFGLINPDPVNKVADNGLVIADSDEHRIRVRSNLENFGGTHLDPGPTTLTINEPGEDVTYFFDEATKSIVRYDPNGLGFNEPETSVVVNRISSVKFEYYDFEGTSTAVGPLDTPTLNTARVRVIVEVELEPVAGQPDNVKVTLASEITLRNNNYMLQQY